jgi:hypothetical protein
MVDRLSSIGLSLGNLMESSNEAPTENQLQRNRQGVDVAPRGLYVAILCLIVKKQILFPVLCAQSYIQFEFPQIINQGKFNLNGVNRLTE